MKLLERIADSFMAVLTAFLLVGAGFVVCLLGPFTHTISRFTAWEDISPFDRDQLALIADATRDFAFLGHDELALYQANYQICEQVLSTSPTETLPAEEGFPDLGLVKDPDSLDQYQRAFAGASDRYRLSPDMISHLDDCNAIARTAYPLLAGVTALVAIVLVRFSRKGKVHRMGRILLGAGAITLASFAILGIWAAVDFASFFTAFHGVLFSQGNWTFAYDSLLICSLPTEFWMGMGGVWLLVTASLSVVALVMGTRLLRGGRTLGRTLS